MVTASRAVLSAAGLAFLGLGDPTTWSWGRILYEAQQSGAMSSAWWLTLFPSIAILLLVLSRRCSSIAYNDARNPRTGPLGGLTCRFPQRLDPALFDRRAGRVRDRMP